MDPRFSDEGLAFINLIMQSPPPENPTDVKTNRELSESLHAFVNQKLIGTFKGTQKEQLINANSTGWTVNSRKTHQTMVNMLADATKTIWISVGYRLGPEFKFPIWWNDVYEVTKYIIENKQSFGVDASAKIGVAGESCGSTMSTALCRELKNIDFQILVYGIFNLNRIAPSYKEFVHPMYFLTPETLDWLTASAFRDMKDANDPRVSVLLNNSFEGLPPCLLIVAELDPLRDDSYAYQKVLDEAGVQTKLVLIKGVLHGFFSVPGIYPKACAEVVNAIEEFIVSL